MRNNEEVSIGQAIGNMFSSFKLSDEVKEHRIKNVLQELFGKIMENYITKVTVKDDLLFLHIKSSTLRHELFLNRIQMKDRINEELGEKLINKIILK